MPLDFVGVSECDSGRWASRKAMQRQQLFLSSALPFLSHPSTACSTAIQAWIPLTAEIPSLSVCICPLSSIALPLFPLDEWRVESLPHAAASIGAAASMSQAMDTQWTQCMESCDMRGRRAGSTGTTGGSRSSCCSHVRLALSHCSRRSRSSRCSHHAHAVPVQSVPFHVAARSRHQHMQTDSTPHCALRGGKLRRCGNCSRCLLISRS